jgi:micrococcal nuclease
MEPSAVHLYTYRAHCTRAYDADTITVDVDLGMHVTLHGITLRLSRIDAPEVRGEERPEGLAARDFLRALVVDQDVLIQTFKDAVGKYGRYIAEVWVEHDEGLLNMSDHLVANGHAEYREY